MSSQLSSIDWTTTFIPIIEAGLVELLLYGIYVPLFATCVYILGCSGRQQSGQSMLLIPITIMFCLSTADIAVTFTLAAKHITSLFEPLGQEALSLAFPKVALYGINNLIADFILLYRCYVIWESNVFVIIPPLPGVIAGTVFMFVVQTSPAESPLRKYVLVYGWIVVYTNVYLTAMTAGRIWWVVRKARESIHARQVKRYRLIIMAIIESGAIYSGCILATLVATGSYALFITSIYGKIVCIMPALIVVQLGLGRAFNISPRSTRLSTLSTSMAQPSTRMSTMLDTLSGPVVMATRTNEEPSNTREESPTHAV
ncbi:hypothetical protein BDN72DRAFT_490310 [Pluteus cervinus]|uniref:Uncharacterized protein n=1 Tax=Pluteus cervinus TaxID=181527 RepID=A0ACD3A5S3_9AGAR|nr:hypothetical protein BDN72DRAFT_490310 [Pluteus cervinus]